MTDQTGYTEQKEEGRQILPFANWLAAHRQGLAALEWSEALNSVVEAVQEHGQSATLTIKIVVRPTKSDALEVSEDVSVKLPTAPKSASLFYADADHNLVREDPAQQRLPLAGPTGVAAPQTKEA